METSKEIIEQAKQKFKELKRKNYDWSSFYNGFLEAKVLSMSEVSSNEVELAELKELYNRKRLQNIVLKKEKKQIKDFCNHLNTYKGLEDIRFDFMLVDFFDRSKSKVDIKKICKNCGDIMDEDAIPETELCSGCFTMNA